MGLKLILHLKEYQGKEILQNKEFSFSLGKIYVIVGKSGSGKTTLLNILSGQDTFFDGELVFKNEIITNTKNRLYKKKVVAFFTQYPAFFEDLNGKNNILISSFGKNNKNASTFLSDSTLNKTVSFYSGGERKKLSFSLHNIKNKSVLLFDEPTNGLDEKSQEMFFDFLLQQNHAIIVLTTHSLEIAKKYADEVITL